ncbi:sulfatase-like hydrolase/transferase [Rhizobium johnstonii]|uniref:sulfatase-like hydrolase/transferase n=1 Tax=Rhizobium johnstonii TaxID=3019933 RepID=UPI003F9B1536
MMKNGVLARDRIFLFLAIPMALASPVISTLSSLSISPVAPGANAFLGIIVAVGCLLGFGAAVLHPRQGLWKFIQVFLISVGIMSAVDLSIMGHQVLTTSFDNRFARALVLCFFAAGIFGVVWIIRNQAPVILFVTSATLLASSVVISEAKADEIAERTIYIITDEMIGLNGIDKSLPGGRDTYDLMKSVFLKHGFRLFPRAFSRHFFTMVSIPAALNFDDRDAGDQAAKYTDNETPMNVMKSALFDQFASGGYDVTVFQSGHLNFCTQAVSECNTFPSFNADTDLAKGLTRDLTKISTIRTLKAIYVQSYTAARLLPWYSEITGESDLGDIVVPDYFDIHGFLEWFRKFSDHALASKPGGLTFAHFLMPHNPPVLDENCVAQYRWENPYYLKESKHLSGQDFSASRAHFYEEYYQQARCALKTLDAFLTTVDNNPELSGAKIVVHGDHGSRISSGKFVEGALPRDMIDNFSTLYAIRGKGIEPGIDMRMASVQRLTTEYLSGIPVTALGPEEMSVVMDSSKSGRPIKAPPPPIQ